MAIIFTLGITRGLDFVHRPVFEKLENTTFRKLDLFPSTGEGGGEIHLLSWVPKGPFTRCQLRCPVTGCQVLSLCKHISQ
jgi:hypothetical protein